MNHTSQKSITLSKIQTMNMYLLTQTLSVFLMQTLMRRLKKRLAVYGFWSKHQNFERDRSPCEFKLMLRCKTFPLSLERELYLKYRTKWYIIRKLSCNDKIILTHLCSEEQYNFFGEELLSLTTKKLPWPVFDLMPNNGIYKRYMKIRNKVSLISVLKLEPCLLLPIAN